jgi:hypothetical protein
MKLGGFAATLKNLTMMMTQWGLAQREHGARARMVSCVAAAVIAMGFAVLCTARAAMAEVHPVPMRHGATARQAYWVQTAHAKPRRDASAARASRETPRSASSKRSTQQKAAVTTGKAGTRAKARRHNQPQVDDRNAPVLHRASVGRKPGRQIEPVIVARLPHNGPIHAAPRENEAVASRLVTADVKPLTTDDFLHAASAPAAAATATYASGESHPDDDVTSPQPRTASAILKPMPAKQPVVVARVEAAPAEGVPASMEHAAPSDLVGAPISNTEARTTRVASQTDDSSDAPLPAISRQELIAEVQQPLVMPGIYRNGRLVVPAPLKGTREILVHQNIMADDEGLQRVQDDDDLRRMRASRQLVDFPESASLHLNPELNGDRRCARPWAVRFAADIARAYYARFHESLQLNSAVRTVAYQVRLRRVNGNAAGIDGEAASPHLTGEAIDFGKRGMSMEQIAWMRTYLLPLMQSGKLDVEEEFQQACFHISVYRTYAPPVTRRPAVRSEVAQLHAPRVSRAATRTDQDQ